MLSILIRAERQASFGAAYWRRGLMENVRIRMFGRLEMTLGAERLRPFATRKSRSLFAYLLLYRDRCHPRDVLAGMFWGEYPEPVARKHLRDALWRIRQVVAA